MAFLKRFVSDFKNSFLNPSFYTSLKERGIGSGIAFLVVLVVLNTLIGYVIFAGKVIPVMTSLLSEEYIDANYPGALEIVIKNGIASTNVEEPYLIPIKSETDTNRSEVVKNIAYIDTTHELSLQEITAADSMLILTKNNVVAYQPARNGEIRVFPLKTFGNLTINKENVQGLAKTIIKIMWIAVVPLGIVFVIFVGLLGIVYYLALLLLGAFIPMVIGRLFRNKLTYKNAYIISLFALTPLIVIDTIAMFFGRMSLPFLAVIIIFTVTIVLNLWDSKNPVQI